MIMAHILHIPSPRPTVFVIEDNPKILLQTAEVETRGGEIIMREVVDEYGAVLVTEIALDPMRALQFGEEVVRQAKGAMGNG